LLLIFQSFPVVNPIGTYTSRTYASQSQNAKKSISSLRAIAVFRSERYRRFEGVAAKKGFHPINKTCFQLKKAIKSALAD
jgi:hypothetical protein